MKIKHIQIRLEDDEAVAFEEKAKNYPSQQQAGRAALLEWAGGKPAGKEATLAAHINKAVSESVSPLKATLERIEVLARARVVEVSNQEEQDLLKRIVQLLHVTGFPKRLRDLLREVERERGKTVVDKSA